MTSAAVSVPGSGPEDTRSVQPVDATPICVDLDGTLIKTDLLIELVFGLIRQHPSEALRLPLWLIRGKSFLKTQLAARVSIDVRTLPYHEEVIAWLKTQKAAGRRIVLATASPIDLARAIAAHVGIFDDVMGTCDVVNLASRAKRDRLVATFGLRGFDYAGNAWADLPIWKVARKTILVNPHFGVPQAARLTTPVTTVIDDRPSLLRAMLKAIRAHQWVKNLLVFVPLGASHLVTDLALLRDAFMGFVALSLCASAIYLFNDLLDVNADRDHPVKKKRALASGEFPISTAALLIPLLLAGADYIGREYSPKFHWSLVVYTVVSALYSVWLKKHELADTIVLAGLWTLRVIIGGAVTGIELSFWLLAFTMFLFMSFALAKRCSELYAVRSIARERALGRDYRVTDLAVLAALGGSSGCMAVLVLALYLNSPEVELLYRFSRALWLLCPMLMYWVGRVWLKTWRGEMAEDPVLFAVGDRASRWLVIAAAVIIIVAS